MREDQILRFLWLLGISLFYAFTGGVILFLLNGIKNGWIYRASSASYEFSFSFAIIISLLILVVFSVLLYVVSMIFWTIMREK